jgi:hypothetical protein
VQSVECGMQDQATTPNERKSHEAHYPPSEPVAPSQELQTKACYSNPAAAEAEYCVPPREPVWREAAINSRLVVQKVLAHGHQRPADNRKIRRRSASYGGQAASYGSAGRFPG